MKTFINIYSIFALLLVTFTGLAAADDSTACSKKSHGQAITNAIGKYCQRGHNAGTSEAAFGAYSDDKYGSRYQVAILGNCKKPQYVPQDICFTQFWNMCATGKGDGSNSRWYGWKGNNCQNWVIRQRY